MTRPAPYREQDEPRFGDEGGFAPAPPPAPHGISWPTVLASAGAAAVVSAIILAIGVVGLHRSSETAAQPAVVRVVTDGASAAAPGEADAPAPPGDEPAPPPGDGAEAAAVPAPAGPAPNALPVPEAGGASGGAGSAPAAAPDGEAQSPAAHPAPEPAPAPEAPAGGELTAWQPSSPLPAGFAVTDPQPDLDQLNGIVYTLVASPSDAAAKARNLEAGQAGAIVPTTVYNLGLFRAPRGWFRVTGPVQRQDGRITAQLHTFSAGMPGVDMPIDFVYSGGNWKLASSSLCAGVKAVGLPIYCNA